MKRLPLLLLVLSTISGTAGTATVALRVGSPPQGPNAEDVAREMPSHVRVEHVATRSEAINGALPLERSYSARDGFGFSYPAGWFVEAHEVGTVSFLTNFRLGVTCCHMVDGQIKVDFWSLPTSEAREMDLTYDERCAGVGEDRVISCSQHRTPSAVW